MNCALPFLFSPLDSFFSLSPSRTMPGMANTIEPVESFSLLFSSNCARREVADIASSSSNRFNFHAIDIRCTFSSLSRTPDTQFKET